MIGKYRWSLKYPEGIDWWCEKCCGYVEKDHLENPEKSAGACPDCRGRDFAETKMWGGSYVHCADCGRVVAWKKEAAEA